MSFEMKKISLKQFDPSYWAIFICLFVVLYSDYHNLVWENEERVIIHDVLPFYAYLPATIIYHDLSLEFLKHGKDRLGKNFWGKKGPLDKTVITASSGMSILYFPSFIITHSALKLLGYPANGYSPPYRFALVMSSLFYLMMGAIFLRKFLVKYFPKPVVAITMLVTILATNLLWYVTIEPGMSHVYSFALISIFIYIIDLWFEKPKIKYSIIIGLLTGIISLVRPTNIVVVILFLLWKTDSWESLKTRFFFLLNKWPLIITMAFMFFVVWVPQMLYWKYVTGGFFYYSYPDSQGFFFLNPQFYGTLFSWRKGLLIYTPVMIFAIIGFGILYKSKKEFFWPIVIYSLINWYIISSWWDWWYGGSFGLRPFIDSYGIFAIGLAAFLTWVFKTIKLKRTILLVFFTLVTLLSAWHYKRYYNGSIHWVAMTREAYFNSFWRAHPAPDFYQKLRHPDYKLARKGIYKYKDEAIDSSSE